MRRPALWGAAAAAGVILAGCPDKEPSAEYQAAQAAFSALYGEHLEDAYLQPEMAAIEAQLETVPEASSDHRVAQELLKRIRSGRERRQEALDETARAIEEAGRPVQDFAFTSEPFPDAGQPPPVDAGSPHPVEGMTEAELNRRFGDCFKAGQPIEVDGRGTLRSYRLRPSAYCTGQHPGFDQKILFLEEERIALMGDAARLEMVPVDAGVPPAPVPVPAPVPAPAASPDAGGY